MAVLEAIAVTFAAISAAKDGIDLWNMTKDRRQAADAIKGGIATHIEQGRVAARQLQSISVFANNGPITDVFEERIKRCREAMLKIVEGDRPDSIVDKAMSDFKMCVCKEINRLKAVAPLPVGWQGQWDEFDCSAMGLPRL